MRNNFSASTKPFATRNTKKTYTSFNHSSLQKSVNSVNSPTDISKKSMTIKLSATPLSNTIKSSSNNKYVPDKRSQKSMTLKQTTLPLSNELMTSSINKINNSHDIRSKNQSMTIKQSPIPLYNNLESFNNNINNNSLDKRTKKSMTVKHSALPLSNSLKASNINNNNNSHDNRSKKSMTIKQYSIPLSNNLELFNNNITNNSLDKRSKKSMTVKHSALPLSNSLKSSNNNNNNYFNDNRSKKSMTIKQSSTPLSNNLELLNNKITNNSPDKRTKKSMTVKHSTLPLSNSIKSSDINNINNSHDNRSKKSMTIKQSSIPISNKLKSLVNNNFTNNSPDKSSKKSMTVKHSTLPISNKLKDSLNNINNSKNNDKMKSLFNRFNDSNNVRNNSTKKNTTRYENRMKLDLKDNKHFLEKINENDIETNMNQDEDYSVKNRITQIDEIIIENKLDLKDSQASSQNEKDVKSLKSNNTNENENDDIKSNKSIGKIKSNKSIYSHNSLNKNSKIDNNDIINEENDVVNLRKSKNSNYTLSKDNKSKEENIINNDDNQDNQNNIENNININEEDILEDNNNKRTSKDIQDDANTSINRIFFESKIRNKIIEKSNNISDKNKNMIKELLSLLDEKYDRAKDSENDNNFLKTLKELNKTEKNKNLALIYKRGKKIFQFNNLKNGNINAINKPNQSIPGTNEEKYQNIKNRYMPMMSLNKKVKPYYEDQYFNEHKEGKYPISLKLSGANTINNKNSIENDKINKNNILFKSYEIKGKNKSSLLNERSNEYSGYNYKMILNCIEDRLQSLKSNEIIKKNKNSRGNNSCCGLKLKDYNIYCCKAENEKNNNIIHNRFIRVRNMFEQIKKDIDSIQIPIYNYELKRVFSENNSNRRFLRF